MPWMMYMEEAATWITEFGINKKGENSLKNQQFMKHQRSPILNHYWGNQ